MGKWINYFIMITVSLADNIFPDKKDGGGRLKEDSDVMMTRLETHTTPEGCSPSRNFFQKGDDSALSCLALCVCGGMGVMGTEEVLHLFVPISTDSRSH